MPIFITLYIFYQHCQCANMHPLETFLLLVYTYMTHFGKISWFYVAVFKIFGHIGMERCTKNKNFQ